MLTCTVKTLTYQSKKAMPNTVRKNPGEKTLSSQITLSFSHLTFIFKQNIWNRSVNYRNLNILPFHLFGSERYKQNSFQIWITEDQNKVNNKIKELLSYMKTLYFKRKEPILKDNCKQCYYKKEHLEIFYLSSRNNSVKLMQD